MWKMGPKYSDYTEEYHYEVRCANCQGKPSSILPMMGLLEKEIVHGKHKRNVSFVEARQIVESNMKCPSNAKITQGRTTTNTSACEKCRACIEDLLQLGLAHIQNYLKDMCSKEILQTEKKRR